VRLKHLRSTGFTTYDVLDLTPPPGLTLITGLNGTGKSTIPEVVTWIIYGELIRGTSPVNGQPCQGTLEVEVSGQTYRISRRWAKSKSLSFELETLDGWQDLSGQTATQTQSRIGGVFGSFERHVSSRVFSQEHVARFAAATDKGRKQLLEQVMGLEQFDAALDLARRDSKAAQATLSEAKATQARAEGRLESCQRRLAELEPPDAPSGLEETLKELATRVQAAKEADEEASGILAGTRQALAAETVREQTLFRTLREVKARIANMESAATTLGDPCPTCGQVMGPEDQACVQRSHDVALAAERERLAETQLAYDYTRAAMQDLQAECETHAQSRIRARDLYVDLLGEHGEAEKLLISVQAYERVRDQAEDAFEAAAKDVEAKRLGVQEAKAGVARLEAIEEIHGLRGARTLMFGKGLARLERSANAVLIQLGSKIRVSLSGRSTQASGKEVDAVSVKVTGAGGGEYRGASRGQRNLVDLALLLGMADLQGASDGFLSFDEIIDALDSRVTQSVAEYFGRLARTRQVLVLSPHDHLEPLFPEASRYEVTMDAAGVSSIKLVSCKSGVARSGPVAQGEIAC
jgi:DNA repair exonuclease SbcCD ATPase subunit